MSVKTSISVIRFINVLRRQKMINKYVRKVINTTL